MAPVDSLSDLTYSMLHMSIVDTYATTKCISNYFNALGGPECKKIANTILHLVVLAKPGELLMTDGQLIYLFSGIQEYLPLSK